VNAKSTRMSFCVMALSLAAVLPLASASASKDGRGDSATQVCLDPVEARALSAMREPHSGPVAFQGAGETSAALGYCTLDCSVCSTNSECWSRGAGWCEPIQACRQGASGSQVE